jgi:hypothetical protein
MLDYIGPVGDFYLLVLDTPPQYIFETEMGRTSRARRHASRNVCGSNSTSIAF